MPTSKHCARWCCAAGDAEALKLEMEQQRAELARERAREAQLKQELNKDDALAARLEQTVDDDTRQLEEQRKRLQAQMHTIAAQDTELEALRAQLEDANAKLVSYTQWLRASIGIVSATPPSLARWMCVS